MLAYRRHLRREATSRPQPPTAPARTTVPTSMNSAARNLAAGLNSFDAMFNKLSQSSSLSSIDSDSVDTDVTGPEAEARECEEDERIVDAELLAWERMPREQKTYVNSDLVAFWQVCDFP